MFRVRSLAALTAACAFALLGGCKTMQTAGGDNPLGAMLGAIQGTAAPTAPTRGVPPPQAAQTASTVPVALPGSSTSTSGAGTLGASGDGAASSRTPAEVQLQERTVQMPSVVMGGFLKHMLERVPGETAACMIRFSTNAKSREACVKAIVVSNTIVGLSQGYMVGVRAKAANDEVQAMRTVTNDMRADNQRLQEVVEASEAVVRETEVRLASLRADINAKRASKDDIERARARSESNAAQIRDAIVSARQTRDEYAKSAATLKVAPAQKSEVDAQIAQMNAKIANLERLEKRLVEVSLPAAL